MVFKTIATSGGGVVAHSTGGVLYPVFSTKEGGGYTRLRVRLTQGVFERNYNVNFRLFAKKQTIVFNINALPVPPGSEVHQPHPAQLPSSAFHRSSCS